MTKTEQRIESIDRRVLRLEILLVALLLLTASGSQMVVELAKAVLR